MTNSLPLVSVVIPSLNQAEFIEETICSVLNQTYKNIEVIVVDGGSTDGTLELLKSYGNKIRWTSEADDGIADAMNKGVELSRGDIIGWLNSDDVYFGVESISDVVEEFLSNPNADVVYGDVAIISKDSRILRFRLLPPYNRNRLWRQNVIAQPGALLRSRVARTEKLQSYLSLDYEYWLRLTAKRFEFHHLPQIISGDRQYPERLSMRNWEQIEREMKEYNPQRSYISSRIVYRLIDRSLQAILRFKGVFVMLHYLIRPSKRESLAFDGKFDSPMRCLYRQLFKSVTSVE